MSTSSQHAALSFRMCWVKLEYLISVQNHRKTHRHLDHVNTKSKDREGKKVRESTLEEDILPLMSAPPLGGISLTFTVCWTAALLFSTLFSVFSFLPVHSFSFYPLPSQLSVCSPWISYTHLCCLCSCRCLITHMLHTSTHDCFPVCGANKPSTKSGSFFSSLLGRAECVMLSRTETG